MILFLDYDGVLHPASVFQDEAGQPVLEHHGHALFEHAQTLIELLEPHPQVEIVLSTSWVYVDGFEKAKAWLPEALQARVTAATFHKFMNKADFTHKTRFAQIQRYVMKNHLKHWVAIDDNAFGWPEHMRNYLVHTDQVFGLGLEKTQIELAAALAKLQKRK